MPVTHETYLGDGVYASFDGFNVWLDLRAQKQADGHVCQIALEPAVLAALDDYRRMLSEKEKDNPAVRYPRKEKNNDRNSDA